jgi:hypothetical protein
MRRSRNGQISPLCLSHRKNKHLSIRQQRPQAAVPLLRGRGDCIHNTPYLLQSKHRSGACTHQRGMCRFGFCFLNLSFPNIRHVFTWSSCANCILTMSQIQDLRKRQCPSSPLDIPCTPLVRLRKQFLCKKSRHACHMRDFLHLCIYSLVVRVVP